VGLTRYLADKSALARIHVPSVREELEPLIERALVGMCGVTKLEMLYSARNISERARMRQRFDESMEQVSTPENVWDLASEIQEALTEQGQHRCASIPDLLIAATSRRSLGSPSNRRAGSSRQARCEIMVWCCCGWKNSSSNLRPGQKGVPPYRRCPFLSHQTTRPHLQVAPVSCRVANPHGGR
jgi:predicted nucleic acid-binding protein